MNLLHMEYLQHPYQEKTFYLPIIKIHGVTEKKQPHNSGIRKIIGISMK